MRFDCQKIAKNLAFFFKKLSKIVSFFSHFWQFFWKKCQVFGNFFTFKWQFPGGSGKKLGIWAICAIFFNDVCVATPNKDELYSIRSLKLVYKQKMYTYTSITFGCTVESIISQHIITINNISIPQQCKNYKFEKIDCIETSK